MSLVAARVTASDIVSDGQVAEAALAACATHICFSSRVARSCIECR